MALQHEPARRHKDPSLATSLHRGQSNSISLLILIIGQVTNNFIFYSFTVPQSMQVPIPESLQSHYKQAIKIRYLDTMMARAMAQIHKIFRCLMSIVFLDLCIWDRCFYGKKGKWIKRLCLWAILG